jgi:hypothetical protein
MSKTTNCPLTLLPSLLLPSLLLLTLLLLPLQLSASQEEASTDPFYPVWKLLNTEQKQQFIAGYLRGWLDAARVTDVAIEFVEAHPQQALSGLRRLKQLYAVGELAPDSIVRGIDRFYGDPENHKLPLSSALSSARSSR